MISLELAKKLKPCECGCGELINPIDKKGRPRRYLPGHSSKTNHPMLGKRAPNNKGGHVSRQGYRLIYIPLGLRDRHTCKKDGCAFEHRFIMEKYLGRKLTNKEVVHHKNGNKLDNCIENLILMTVNEHASYESRIRPINWEAIEAMRRVNLNKAKLTCIVDGCDNQVKSNSLCNKHHHLYRKNLLFVIGGRVIIVKNKRKKQIPKTKTCKQCKTEFLSSHNRHIYCERCATPYQHTKRTRLRKRGVL